METIQIYLRILIALSGSGNNLANLDKQTLYEVKTALQKLAKLGRQAETELNRLERYILASYPDDFFTVDRIDDKQRN